MSSSTQPSDASQLSASRPPFFFTVNLDPLRARARASKACPVDDEAFARWCHSACARCTVGRFRGMIHTTSSSSRPGRSLRQTMAAFSRPMIGHRSEDFKNLYRDVHPKLQKLFVTKQPVFLSTSSAWGVMEASIRNVVD